MSEYGHNLAAKVSTESVYGPRASEFDVFSAVIEPLRCIINKVIIYYKNGSFSSLIQPRMWTWFGRNSDYYVLFTFPYLANLIPVTASFDLRTG